MYKRLFFFAVVAAASGCGGGGSSGGGTDGGTNPPIAIPRIQLPELPTFDELILNSANSIAAGSTVIRAMEQTSIAASMAAFISDLAVTRSGAGRCATFANTSIAAQLLDLDRNGAASVGDQLTAQYVSCAAPTTGEVIVTITSLTSNSGQFEARVDYTSEDFRGITYRGTFVLTAPLGRVGQDVTQSVKGIHVVVSNASGVEHVAEARLEQSFPGNAYVYDFAGRVASESLNGDYRFETTQKFSGTTTAVPTAGALTLTGNASGARFSPTEELERLDDTTDLALDSTGSGRYDAAGQVPWARITTGLLFRWHPNTRPRITNMSISPAGASSVDDLTVSFSAVDADGDSIQPIIRWSRNGEPIGDGRDILAAGSFQRGDLVQASVQVQDNSSYDVATAAVTIANAPPRRAAVVLSPDSPRFVDDFITASWSADDPDGDALGATFNWAVNGSMIPGNDTFALSNAHYRKGDIVTATAHIDDGSDSVAASASVTIQDSPAYVLVPSPPADVAHGNSASFAAVAADPDGDSVSGLRFALAYGPSGMTVDPLTGYVDWTASGPMFTPTTTVNWGVTVDETEAGVATGSMTVTDLDHDPPFMRSHFALPRFEGLQVGDLEGDGSLALLVNGDNSLYELRAAPPAAFHQTWVYPFAVGESIDVTALAHGDVDGDGRDEIFIAGGREIAKLDGLRRNRVAVASLPVDSKLSCTEIEFGDLNRDGRPEIVCLTTDFGSRSPGPSRQIMVFDADSLTLLAVLSGTSYGSSIAIGNVDADSALELVTANGYVFDGLDLLNPSTSVTAQSFYAPGFGWNVAVGDVTGNATDEIVAIDISSATPGITIFDGSSPTITIISKIPEKKSLVLNLTDFAGDQKLEIIVGDGFSDVIDEGFISAYSAATMPYSALFSASVGLQDVYAATVADIDNDGEPELVWGNSNALEIRNVATPDLVEWAVDFDVPEHGLSRIHGGSLLNDPSHAPSVAFLSNNAPIVMNPSDGSLTFGTALGMSYDGPVTRISQIAFDYDNDGVDELAIAMLDSSSGSYTAIDLAYDFWRGVAEWRSEDYLGTEGTAGIAHRDLNSDSHEDLIAMTAEGVVRLYDVFNSVTLWESSSLGIGVDIAIADLDDDGNDEIIAVTEERIVVFRSISGGEFVESAASGMYLGIRDIEVGDTDGDSEPELYVIYGVAESTDVQTLNTRLQTQESYRLPWHATGVVIEQSAYARKNLVMSVSESAAPSILDTMVLVTLDPRTGSEIWRSPSLRGDIRKDGVHFLDVEDDGNYRISISSGSGAYLTR